MAFEQAALSAAHSVVDESAQYLENLQNLQSNFQANSAARGAVGKNIADLSEKLGTITGALKEVQNISMQVKMLSINASIEAARAGVAGKGFAVVASEIGKLSQNTDAAVSNIEESISGMTQLLQATVADMGVAKSVGNEFETRLEECVSAMRTLHEHIEKQ